MSAGHLLIIDDDQSFRTVWEFILRQAGFSVDAVPNLVEAEISLRTRRPDVIICDVDLSEADAFAFVSELKKSPETRGIPVIMVSGLADQPRRQLGEICGAEMILVKPFGRQELLDAVARVLQV